MSSHDKRAIARELAQKAWAENRPLEWFEELYQKAELEGAPIPWGDLAPNPNLPALFARYADIRFAPLALKVGCGLGDDAEWLSGRGFQVTAFDIAPTAIARCRERFPDSHVTYAVADLFDSPAAWNGAFDLVLESYTLQALPHHLRHEAIRCISAYVAPGGYLLVIARARNEDEPTGNMPWPLVRSEADLFNTFGLKTVFFEDVVDLQESPTRRFRICYQKTA